MSRYCRRPLSLPIAALSVVSLMGPGSAYARSETDVSDVLALLGSSIAAVREYRSSSRTPGWGFEVDLKPIWRPAGFCRSERLTLLREARRRSDPITKDHLIEELRLQHRYSQPLKPGASQARCIAPVDAAWTTAPDDQTYVDAVRLQAQLTSVNVGVEGSSFTLTCAGEDLMALGAPCANASKVLHARLRETPTHVQRQGRDFRLIYGEAIAFWILDIEVAPSGKATAVTLRRRVELF